MDLTPPTILIKELSSTNSGTNIDLGSNTLLAKKDDKVTLTFTTSERVIDPEVQINNFQAETSYLNFDGDDDCLKFVLKILQIGRLTQVFNFHLMDGKI